MQKFLDTLQSYEFLQPQLINQLEARVWYAPEENPCRVATAEGVRDAFLSAPESIIAQSKNVNLKRYEFSERYFDIEFENTLLYELYQIFYTSAKITDIRDANFSNVESPQEGAQKLQKLINKELDKNGYYYPTFGIVSATMYHYLVDAPSFVHIAFDNRPYKRLILEGVLNGTIEIFVDWFAKEDFLFFGDNKYDNLRMHYNLNQFNPNQVAFTVNTFCREPEKKFTAFLVANPRDPMEANMTNKNPKQFFEI